MEQLSLEEVHKTLIGFTQRAERATDESLRATFVDSAPLFALLSTGNNQVIYGRRGTGKTHALKVLAGHVTQRNEVAVFLDMRTIGSNGSIYADQSRPLVERASVLLSDALAGLVNEFYQIALEIIAAHPHPAEVTRRLDAMQASITTVTIRGDVAEEHSHTENEKQSAERKITVGLSSKPEMKASVGKDQHNETSVQHVRKATGREQIHLNFGSIAGALVDLVSILAVKRLWFLVDEWSEVPVDLQPYLADLFRRVVLPVNNITVKIAAIEHRTNFAILKDQGEYVGLELGADIAADLNLDDFLVFDNNQKKSVEFIGDLLFRHFNTANTKTPFANQNDLVGSLFTQKPVFEEFVRAVEGVPRDALNLISKIVTKAYGQPIAMNHVRAGARDWYNQDKAAVIRNDTALADLLQQIIDDVIGGRKARAFLLSSTARHPGVDRLFDSRLLHILKKNVSSHDEPGARYDVYKIDYGCYVDLINTKSDPAGLFQLDDGSYTEEVPKDDYRSIRRAILRPGDTSAHA